MNPAFAETLANARQHLLAEKNEAGHWEGELSTSALSTATAIVALHSVDSEKHETLIEGGLRWLIEHQNEDGGWGDTILSHSNISTTLLCWGALNLNGADKRELAPPEKQKPNHKSGEASSRLPAISKAETWIQNHVGSLETEAIVEAVKARYGKDRTFSVPILMHCAICGRLGAEREAWKRVLPLPFELSVFPRSWYAALQLPVVSYALPALIAIGYARFFHVKPWFPFSWIRKRAWRKASRLLAEIQPTTGGFLEAAPLTSFVTMALASSGQKQHPVVEKAVEFLIASVRPDGGWPIDTNLATWVTTLSVKALIPSQQGVIGDSTLLDRNSRERLRGWLLKQQYRKIHPFTATPPGGWAWTDLPGGVPDADDTPGALLALKLLADDESFPACCEAAQAGITWLLNLQNRDGGIPTFCRGWGALPFDRSSPDLTAHTLRAWRAWMPDVHPTMRARIRLGIEKGLAYLKRSQNDDGSWSPLWFGNQHRVEENNPTYGTAKVLLALKDPQSDPDEHRSVAPMAQRGADWLAANQNNDGGWGGGQGTPSSIEETALAVEALHRSGTNEEPIRRGVEWLVKATHRGTAFPPSPIGFYFAKLWYFEKLYPQVWTVSALESVSNSEEFSGSETAP